MRDIIVHFLIGLIFGIVLTAGLILSNERIRAFNAAEEEVKENVSLSVPSELPTNEENYDAELPQNLSEVILWTSVFTHYK